MHVTKLKGQMRAKQTCRSTVNMDHKLRVVSQDVRPETFKTVPNNERIRLLCETLGALFGNPSHALQLCSWPSQPLRLHPVQRCIETCEQVKTDCASCGIQQLPLPVWLRGASTPLGNTAAAFFGLRFVASLLSLLHVQKRPVSSHCSLAPAQTSQPGSCQH
jgi:hypothetical protein